MRIAQAKKCLGGTAREEVPRQLDALEKQLEADEALTADRVAGLAAAKARLDAATNSMITAYPFHPTENGRKKEKKPCGRVFLCSNEAFS